MKKIHFTLQGKGGVGKSFIATLLAQYHQENQLDTQFLDADPVNSTFAGFKAFEVQRIALLEGTEINPRKFDAMMEMILKEDSHFVIDTGAASFLPLSNYMIENNIVELLDEAGKQVVLHNVITGGLGLRDTLTGFVKLMEHISPSAEVIVWLNEYFGPIVSEDGKDFETMKAYTQHKARVSGLIRIAQRTSATFGQDIVQMLHHRATFEEVKSNPVFELMAKQRLHMVKKDLFEQMALVAV
jgi:shikimate kinase